jgi:hypothetical protein
MAEIILRPVINKDIPFARKLLKPWIEEDPAISDLLQQLRSGAAPEGLRCRVLEANRAVRAVSLWRNEEPNRVRLLAFACQAGALEPVAERGLLHDEIIQWAAKGISGATVNVPRAVSSSTFWALRNSGFLLDGIGCGQAFGEGPRVRLTKYFLYQDLPREDLKGFLQRFFTAMGCETRLETDGFSYRLREDFRLPFTFSQWHRITDDGADIILRPPARILELHELETLFFPMRIVVKEERPLLVSIDRTAAEELLDLPSLAPQQKSLFNDSPEAAEKNLCLNNSAVGHLTGKKPIRKGLAMLFYVNRVGVVGSARVEDTIPDETASLSGKVDDSDSISRDELADPKSGLDARMGRLATIRFQWYKQFKQAVALEQIRSLDMTFNPQRTRAVSQQIFDSIVRMGDGLEPGPS